MPDPASAGALHLDRRQLLAGLLAVAACGPRVPDTVSLQPDGQLVLGCRWVPGDTHVWRTVTRHTTDGSDTRRAEEWTYLVRRVSPDGVARLEGRLTGLGAGLTRDGRAIDEEVLEPLRQREEERAATVQLDIGMDGRVRSCSDTRIGASLPHRLLSLRLPEQPVEAGQSWVDHDLAHHLSGLVPPGLPVSAAGETQLHELSDGTHPSAVLWSRATVRLADGGSGIVLESTATFSLLDGVLQAREVTLDARGLSTSAPGAPGLLTASLSRLGRKRDRSSR